MQQHQVLLGKVLWKGLLCLEPGRYSVLYVICCNCGKWHFPPIGPTIHLTWSMYSSNTLFGGIILWHAMVWIDWYGRMALLRKKVWVPPPFLALLIYLSSNNSSTKWFLKYFNNVKYGDILSCLHYFFKLGWICSFKNVSPIHNKTSEREHLSLLLILSNCFASNCFTNWNFLLFKCLLCQLHHWMFSLYISQFR